MKSRLIKVVLLVISLTLAGCAGKKTAVRDFDGTDDAAADADVKTGVKPVPDAQVAVVDTQDFGSIVIELYPNIAPRMVERFKKLVAEGFYDGTTFHRIDAEGGLIQGGDPLAKDNDPDNDGSGNSSYPDVPAEFSDIPFVRGTVGAAREAAGTGIGGRPPLTEVQARDTANCQFFITLKPSPYLDEDYTVFGKVIGGINNADVIVGAPVQPGTEAPADRIVIKSITLKPRSEFASTSTP